MTEREQRAVRKIWKEKTRRYRARLKQQSTENNHPITPPTHDNENQLLPPQNNVTLAAKRRSDSQRETTK
ncbi:hypothetical protein PV328_008493 [Microctonus aethiopoides]|uniref:Uncharacterized protein n=1 Tax=Microctonus aethiopoides TaxID=144406 RepID=A0AA39FJK2_9HYME|nr:hypothetical protein PV328_008493 [Microctonus aethiopoides]